MPITKDPKKLYIKNGNLPASYINGIASLIENGSTIKQINLPQDYLEGAFPNNSREEELKGSIISLSGNFINNNNHLSFNNGQYAIFNIYPNIEPFNKFLSFNIKTSGNNNSLTLQVFNKEGEKLYDQTKNTSTDWTIEWDLNSLNIGLDELSFKLISNDNIIISNVFFIYDLNPCDVLDIFREVNALTLNNKKSDFYASRIQSDTKKFSELVNGDYIIGYNHVSSITGKFVTINLGSGDWISLDGYDFSHSDNFSGVFNSSYVESGMTTTEIDSCFTFEVQKTIPQDLSDVKNELISKIGDKLTIETFENGIRIKKDGTYVYSACWGSVNVSATTSSGVNTYRGSTTIIFPFEFTVAPIITVGAYSSTPLMANCGNGGITTTNGIITAERTTSGSQTCRYIVEGR